MIKSDIERLIHEVESSATLDHASFSRSVEALRHVFPDAAIALAATTDLVEQVLHLIDAILPAWTIQLTGKAMEPDGHWRCSLRETRGRDEDEVIGLGSGAVVGLALLAALLRVALAKAR
ncbi:MAG: hypothetical protein U1E06_07170 [Tabrizicola sp.]|uniref:hypothetical protein n=1 Tax=Tabrizicola sp. TaxID=2005166 RepID=UPI0027325655|nr:hypothetical protein [Tabrizicola sp.]MDP3264669.1 hypothetical protein [Tabrizicola sp.]MDP3649864.1 hypothetical protein [Paracoccaceae bacterium]MDZ4066621.1 hypothetical protein [Tabrizicola sp.]